jgi:ribosome biogenesis GTPase A
MNIQWFPGHMAKARREISEILARVDIVVEVADARIPLSSRNSELAEITEGKPHVLVLNKSDLADEIQTSKWVKYYEESGTIAVPVLCVGTPSKEDGFYLLKQKLAELAQSKRTRDISKGMAGRTVRIMVMGFPNVGKSAFINKMAGRGTMETGGRPGVTRKQQWLKIGKDYELLDTPGVLLPKLEEEKIALALAWTGAVKDEVYDTVGAASALCGFLYKEYENEIRTRYKLTKEFEETMQLGYDILLEIGRKRGCLISGGEVDEFRAAALVLDEFRAGKIGKITIERRE